MASQKDSERTAASSGNIGDTAYWVIVDTLGASVKMTIAQFKTFYAAVSSMTGDVTATVVAGVATTTIGALKVATGMIQALAVTTAKIADQAVTYAKIQNMTTARLLGRTTAASGVIEEISVNSTYLDLTAGVLSLSGTTIGGLAVPVVKTATQTFGGGHANITSLTLAIAANTRYFFEFIVAYTGTGVATDYPRFGISGPASPTEVMCQREYPAGAIPDTTGNYVEYGGVGDGTANPSSGGDTDITTVRFARISGIWRNGANAGNIQLRAGSNTANGFTVRIGSFGRLVVL